MRFCQGGHKVEEKNKCVNFLDLMCGEVLEEFINKFHLMLSTNFGIKSHL